MNIAIAGTGYVGLVTGACFAEFGMNVQCVDADASKVERLRKGEIPIYEPGLDMLVERNVRAGRLHFSGDLAAAVADSLVVFIAVGTPQDAHSRADLTFVMQAAGQIADALNGYKVVVTKSTVPVGTGARVRALMAERSGGRQPFSVASNPEFLREGSAIEDFMRPNRVVIGAEDPQAIAILRDLYRPLYLIETPIVVTDLATAELIKYASNAFLAVKISFINEMADLCEKVGADVHAIAKGMGLDQRIGSKFLHPGPGYGGSCFPKDTRAIVESARERGQSLRIISAAVAYNDDRPEQMVAKIAQHLGGDLKGATIGILGLSFKPNTDDIRESAAVSIAASLGKAGARVRAFDPVAMPNARRDGLQVEYCENEYDAAKGADALVIATEWNQFRSLELDRLKSTMKRPVLVDLRNIYHPAEVRAKGFAYACVGRPGGGSEPAGAARVSAASGGAGGSGA
jgi:UDPglucose 6-dehydrogenase